MKRAVLISAVVLLASAGLLAAQASAPAVTPAAAPGVSTLPAVLPDLQSRDGTGAMLKWIVLITLLSLAPALIVMVSSFTRIVIVLGLLRQALATPQLPPNQILLGLAVLMSIVVMAPVYKDVSSQAIEPYFSGRISQDRALEAGSAPVRAFMIRQMEAAGNTDDVYLFLGKELTERSEKTGLAWQDVPTLSLVPAFVVSELKVAFLMGFRIFLPFLIIDMLVASVLVSMGMLMVPPVLVSLPFKLLLFVLADGWRLVVGTLMTSFS